MGDFIKPVVHVRITAPEAIAERVAQSIVEQLSRDFEVIEVAGPKPIHGDDLNKKFYVIVRE